ncbi:hypothetical protein Tco_1073730 [Tanacetum coccineum]
MYTFSPMMVANSRKHHCRVRSYTREVLVISTNLDIQKNHYPLDFRNRRGDEARIKNTWYNQGYCRDHMVSIANDIAWDCQGVKEMMYYSPHKLSRRGIKHVEWIVGFTLVNRCGEMGGKRNDEQ